jgi:6,7-dimethyl-8-ribityllumazine synthase
MSNAISPRPRLAATVKRNFTIVASQFNPEYVQGLVDHAVNEFRAIAPASSLSLHRVPGAFEIPIVVRELAVRGKVDAILAMGVIMGGETDHAENLSRSVTDALQRIAVERGVPVINVVLSLNGEIQARERCLGTEINRGTEAARAAVQIVNVMTDLREK